MDARGPARVRWPASVEQLARRQRGLPDRRRVQKERLRARHTHGDGFAEARNAKIAEKAPEPGDGVIEMGGAIAEVAAETDRGNDRDYPITRLPNSRIDHSIHREGSTSP